MRNHRSSTSLALLLLAAAPGAQSVLVVDAANGPGAHFTDLSDAVAAAAEGDILVLRQGDYPDVLALGGKSLTVTAERLATVSVPSIRVDGLAADDALVVRGVHAIGGDVHGIECRDSAGSILIEDCQSHFAAAGSPGGGVALVDCASVVLRRVHVSAPAGVLVPPAERRGLTCVRSRVHVFDSLVRGGGRQGAGDLSAAPGAPGALVEDSFVTFQGCEVLGGDGADGTGIGSGCRGGDGGHGLVITRTSATVESVVNADGSSFHGGDEGAGTCGSGTPGQSFLVQSGTFSVPPTSGRSLQIVPSPSGQTLPIREGRSLRLLVSGPPLDRVVLRFSLAQTSGVLSPRFRGTSLLGPMLGTLFLGEIGPQGSGLFDVPIPELGPGIQGLRLYAQPLHLNLAHRQVAFGPLVSLVALDRAF